MFGFNIVLVNRVPDRSPFPVWHWGPVLAPAGGSPAPDCRQALTRGRVAVCWVLVMSKGLTGAQHVHRSCCRRCALQCTGCWCRGRAGGPASRHWGLASCPAGPLAGEHQTVTTLHADRRRAGVSSAASPSQRWLLVGGFPV